MPANIIDLLRRNQTVTQNEQPQITTRTTYAVAVTDSENGQVTVKFIGGAGTLNNPQDTPDEDVVILTEDDEGIDETEETGLAESGSSEYE